LAFTGKAAAGCQCLKVDTLPEDSKELLLEEAKKLQHKATVCILRTWHQNGDMKSSKVCGLIQTAQQRPALESLATV